MDDGNVYSSKRIFGGDPNGNVVKLMSFCACSDDVADPWYTRRVDVAYDMINKGCKALLENIKTRL